MFLLGSSNVSDTSGVELRQLEHFIAVAEELSFTRAARRLHVVQSGVSAAIRSLERELGCALFERTSQQVRVDPFSRGSWADRTCACLTRQTQAVQPPGTGGAASAPA
jgi:Bacterial regulatory helix-turn-helix protein, lysR family